MKTYVKNFFLLAVLILIGSPVFTQTATATYFEPGINSPWTIGMDYDFGFARLFSLNTSIQGGINSQVNRISTFGDVYFGEFNLGIRMYFNKFDTWEGLFMTPIIRIGVYNIPFRIGNTQLVVERSTVLQYGFGLYLGYRWKRNLVSDMSDLPFMLMLEPFLGWTLDFFSPNYTQQSVLGINRFTVGISLKLGFYTYKKQKKTLEAEAKAKAETELKNTELKNEKNSKNTNN